MLKKYLNTWSAQKVLEYSKYLKSTWILEMLKKYLNTWSAQKVLEYSKYFQVPGTWNTF